MLNLLEGGLPKKPALYSFPLEVGFKDPFKPSSFGSWILRKGTSLVAEVTWGQHEGVQD